MPISVIDPKAALIVIDLQKGLMAYPTVHPIASVVEKSASLATAFRKRGLPVVLVNVSARAPGRTDAGVTTPIQMSAAALEFVDELGAQPEDLRITKTRRGAFTGTSLDADLRKLGVTQVILTGVATSAGVESTARFAHELDYHVVFAIDAMTDTDTVLHENCIERVFPKMGETATTAQILEKLARANDPTVVG